MRNWVLLAGLVTFMATPSLIGWAADDDDDDEPKFSIEEVMEDGMKGGLLKKIAEGNGSDEEKEEMAEMIKSLEAYEVSKGTQEDWDEKIKTLKEAYGALLEGEEGAAAAVGRAANCMACHQAHKP